MPKRPGRYGARTFRALPIAALVVLTGCANGGPTGAASPASPSPASTSPIAAPSTVTVEPTPDPESAVVGTYQRYLTSTTAAMETGDPEHAELLEVARDQALAAAQARVASLTSAGRTARGRFVPTVQTVEIDGDSATLRDCYRADITEHDAATGGQVADRGGVRLSASVELSREPDGTWVVTAFREGDLCVPDELAATIVERYLAFWEAVGEAGSPPDPDHPALAEAAAGSQLEGLRERLRDFRDEGYEVRDASTSHATVQQVSNRDTVATVRDCRELDPEGGVYDTSTGELVDGGARPGQHALWSVRLERIDGRWKVVDADLAEEDSACAAGS